MISAESTVVTFPSGSIEEESTVLAVIDCGARVGIITGRTPFHPLDHTWPDQPADSGEITLEGRSWQVMDCLTAASPADGNEVFVGAEIPTRRGDLDWRWYVLHLLADDPAPGEGEMQELVGSSVGLHVDAKRRAELSHGHTGCHLMALALNGILAERWRKPVRQDGLGHPDFDAMAITASHIRPMGSTDTYRIGKSLRKKGFDADGLQDSVPEIEDALGKMMSAWIATDAPVHVSAPDDTLTARRMWCCSLPEGTAQIPCGGTHVSGLGQLGTPKVVVALDKGGTELVVSLEFG